MTRPADQRKQSDHRNAQRATRQLQRQTWELETRDAQEAEFMDRTAKLRALRLAKEAADKQASGAPGKVNKSKSKT